MRAKKKKSVWGGNLHSEDSRSVSQNNIEKHSTHPLWSCIIELKGAHCGGPGEDLHGTPAHTQPQVCCDVSGNSGPWAKDVPLANLSTPRDVHYFQE